MKGQKLSVLTNTNRNNDAFSRYLSRADTIIIENFYQKNMTIFL